MDIVIKILGFRVKPGASRISSSGVRVSWAGSTVYTLKAKTPYLSLVRRCFAPQRPKRDKLPCGVSQPKGLYGRFGIFGLEQEQDLRARIFLPTIPSTHVLQRRSSRTRASRILAPVFPSATSHRPARNLGFQVWGLGFRGSKKS